MDHLLSREIFPFSWDYFQVERQYLSSRRDYFLYFPDFKEKQKIDFQGKNG